MIPELRNRFNAQFTPERYQAFLRLLGQKCGVPIGFRNCETPCFFERALMQKMADYGRELVGQIVGNADYLAAAREQIPAAYRVPNEMSHPVFVQADFGLDENLEPKLVEIQGFPSLYAYQPTLAETYREAYGLDGSLSPYFENMRGAYYAERLRTAILGKHAPENVVLLEIEPQQQKTLPDFVLTERMCGIPTICLTEVKQQGKRLFYARDGRLVPIHRIYNRVIVDELMRKPITPGFDFREDLEIEWAGHPNWYFLLSKFALPYFNHVSVPETRFLREITILPNDLDNYVLKPLFSFAGLGVKVGPTLEDIVAVTDPAAYILQRRVNFIPVIETPHGPTKVEIRIMYLWPERAESSPSLDDLQPVTALLRMGRGKMMGVDHNRDLEWVGASAAFLV